MRRAFVGSGGWRAAALMFAVLGLAGCGGGGSDGTGTAIPQSPITRVGGLQGNGDSDRGFDLSADGRLVAFSSLASNFTGTDNSLVYDVFVYDSRTGATTLESVGQGAPASRGNGHSAFPSISGSGQFVAFESAAENLVGPLDNNQRTDIFVRDRLANAGAGFTERVSVAQAGQPAQPNDNSFRPSISADGRFVAFYSFATNLVPEADINGASDAFLFDRLVSVTERVSVGPDGVEANDNSALFGHAVSDDGLVVAFESDATNLVIGDNNGVRDVFVRNRSTDNTTRVSVGTGGAQANGRSRVSSISGDGRFVAFESVATNLVPGDNNGVSDVFVRDLLAGTTTRVSVVSLTGGQANGASFASGARAVSDNGVFVVFESDASNLVPGDTNGVRDVFVHNTVTGVTERLSVTSVSGQPADRSAEGTIGGDGTAAAFASSGTDFVADNPAGVYNIYLRGVP